MQDAELRQLLTERPELWADLQRRAGKPAQPPPMQPPGMPGAGTDAGAYDRQVQQWLRSKRQQGPGGRSGARQDDEIKSIAMLYLAVAVPLLLFGLAAAW